MLVAVEDLGSGLDDLLARAEAGGRVALTREGRLVAFLNLVGDRPRPSAEEKRALFEELAAMARDRGPVDGPVETSNHDDLYDEYGLPA